MNDQACVAFLQWALPHMGMRWKGFRKVRRQVCRRIRGRMAQVGVESLEAYRERLATDPGEWEHLAFLCRVTISRFGRDRGVWRLLADEVLPELARRAPVIRAWSAGCASGEEPFTLMLVRHLALGDRFPAVELQILATDVDPVLLERARVARYPKGTLRELDPDWVARAFRESGDELQLRDEFRRGVRFARQDIREQMPDGPFDLILCRNLGFTYFDEGEQVRLLRGMLERLATGGALVLGAHERLPPGDWPLEPWSPSEPVFRRSGPGQAAAKIEALRG